MTYTHGCWWQDQLEETHESSQVFQKSNASLKHPYKLLILSQRPIADQMQNTTSHLFIPANWNQSSTTFKKSLELQTKSTAVASKLWQSFSLNDPSRIPYLNEMPGPLFKHQRHGIPIIMQQCQQSLFINSICYLSSPACCAGEKKHRGSIESSISDGSHAAFMSHGGKETQISEF